MTIDKVEDEPRAPVEGGCGFGGDNVTVHGSIAGSVAGEGAEKPIQEARYVFCSESLRSICLH